MTVRTKEAEIPSEFPPARLFLDDIEQIVRILVEATESRKEYWKRPNEDAETKVTLTIKDQVCDEVQELPKIATKAIDLSIRVEIPQTLPETSLTFRRYGTSLSLVGFTREQGLSIYHNIAMIFKRRNLWLPTLFRSHSTLLLTLFLLLIIAAEVVGLSNKQTTPRMPALAIVMFLLSLTGLTTGWVMRRHHSIVILRHSSEPSALRQGLLDKLPATLIGVAIGSVLTFILTLLGYYFKHKYWP